MGIFHGSASVKAKHMASMLETLHRVHRRTTLCPILPLKARKGLACALIAACCNWGGANVLLAATPEGTLALMLKGQLLEVKGDTAEAIAVYSQVIGETLSDDIVELARRRVIKVLLQQRSVDLDAVLEHLNALGSDNQHLAADVWNFTARTIFRRVMAANPGDRQEGWAEGIRKLSRSGDSVSLTDATLSDLDGLSVCLIMRPLRPWSRFSLTCCFSHLTWHACASCKRDELRHWQNDRTGKMPLRQPCWTCFWPCQQTKGHMAPA